MAATVHAREALRPAAECAARAHDPADDVVRHFRTKLPVMLDGAVQKENGRGLLLRQARLSLRNGAAAPGQLSTEILRETLDAVTAADNAKTMAGAAPVGPRHARVWWDERVLDSLDDVLAQLDSPRLVLRFHDVTGLDPEEGRWHETFDMDVALHEAGRTVQFWSCDRTYVVDLGYVHADGRFLRLARTNAIDLPRDGKGAPSGGGTARSRLRRAGNKAAACTVPDEAAQKWTARRADADSGRRDWDAELVVHMLYRAFLLEGPRALRRVPKLARREDAVLRGEFALRQRRRRAEAKPPHSPSAFLVRRLDAARDSAVAVGPVMMNLPVAAAISCEQRCEEFAWYQDLIRAASAYRPAASEPSVEHVAAERFDVVAEVPAAARPHIRVAGAEIPAALFATPVFEAARNLRESLAGLRSMESATVEAAQLFDAAEAKRLAKAGVRVSRMSLTLEGRIRPGARLKVAGKLVRADAAGNFRLECILSGRRTSIPMRAGTSISGEARSLISIDWSKRPNSKVTAEL